MVFEVIICSKTLQQIQVSEIRLFIVDGCYIGIFSIVWNNAFRERCIENICKNGSYFAMKFLENVRKNIVWVCCFPWV